MHYSRLLAASLSLTFAGFAAAQAQVSIGSNGVGCGAGGLAVLGDGSAATASIAFDYEPFEALLHVTVANTTATPLGLPGPTITSIFFNMPEATVTSATLVSQNGSKTPKFTLKFDANAADGNDPNGADCLGTFNFKLATANMSDGIAGAGTTVCGNPAATPLFGPVTFVLQLDGPEIHNLSRDVFAASTSRNTARKVNVAVGFDGGDCSGTGFLGNGDVCRVAVFARGGHWLGDTITLSVVGGEHCRAFLGLSATEGPVDLGVVVIPVGLPLMFSFDLGYLPVGVPEAGLPVFIPRDNALNGFVAHMTALTHPFEQELFHLFSFAPAYPVKIGNGLSWCSPGNGY